jgi:tRNA threonylcarbamoyladenosine biosynthesis protein TsaE
MQELGLEDAFCNEICLIEWPDRMGSMAPDNRLDILIQKTETGRDLILRPQGSTWAERLHEL